MWRHTPPVVFSALATTPGPGVLAGQHTRAILAELGYSDGQVATLKEKGTVTWPE
jgi:crotonobetainyl-CoA:carnitine CoA-transferase CaiB-like acyl-CoA transferase